MTPIVHLWASSLTDALLTTARGDRWDRDRMRRAAVALFGGAAPPTWLTPVLRGVRAQFPTPPFTRRHALLTWIGAVPELSVWLRPPRTREQTLVLPLGPHRMGTPRWDVPILASRSDLARWLGVDPWALEWLADRKNLLHARTDGPLHHYRSTWIPKRTGGLRLLETPKPRLREIQRQILRGILDRIPPHEDAHGFVSRRSVLTHAGRHVGQDVLVRMDLRDFFPTTTAKRVQLIFGAAGYPERVASTLAALCTTSAPPHVQASAPPAADRWLVVRRLAGRHLPQGAPTSPALSNLAARVLDVRLAGAAASCGASYSRYADDLAFSGGAAFTARAGWFVALAETIIREEGYVPHSDKTRITGQGGRQILGGVVVNAHPNVPRDELDRLRAILHNCIRSGPAAQNRDGHPDFRGHLLGRIAWVGQRKPARGAQLRAVFDAIRWP